MSLVWDLRLPPGQKLVLLKLADCADDQGGNAFPSVGALADSCSMGRRTVQRTLAELQDGGYLAVQASAQGHRPTIYVVKVGPQGAPITAPDRGAKLAPRQNGAAPPAAERGATGDTPGAPSATSCTDPSVQDPSVPIQGTADQAALPLGVATPDGVVAVWNATATRPFAAVRLPLAPERAARLARACKVVSDLEDWRRLVAWMNGESWMRAKGTGPHPTWVASLDWLVATPGRVQQYLDRALAGRPAAALPTTAAGVRAATRDSGVRATGAGDIDLISTEEPEWVRH